MLRSHFLCLCAAVFISTGGYARAGMTYGFGDSAGNPTDTFTTRVGESVDLNVYLVGTGSDATLLDQIGLLAGGVELRFIPSMGSTGAVMLTSITVGPGFLPPPPDPVIDNDPSGGFGRLALLADPFSPALGFDGRILLGTFTFLGLQQGPISLEAVDPSDPETFLLGDLSGLFDVSSSSQARLTVVPEPSTLVLAAISGFVALGVSTLGRRNPHRGLSSR